ncbi:MAG: hypothetical protein AAGG50_00165 [Bacteroidota bacterium]
MYDNFPSTLYGPLIWQAPAAFWWVRRAPATDAPIPKTQPAHRLADDPQTPPAIEVSKERLPVLEPHS